MSQRRDTGVWFFVCWFFGSVMSHFSSLLTFGRFFILYACPLPHNFFVKVIGKQYKLKPNFTRGNIYKEHLENI